MKKFISIFFLLLSFSANAATDLTTGLIVSGGINDTGYRPDAQIRASGVDGMVAISSSGTSTSDESALAYGLPLSNGVISHTASISAKWSNNDTTVGFGVLRLMASYQGQNNSDVAIRIYGGQGIVLWGGGNDWAPSEYNKLKMYGADGSYGWLYIQNGSLTYRGQDGHITTIAPR